LSASRTDGLLAAGEPRPAALTGGYELAFWVAAALVVAALAVAITVLDPEPPQGQEETADAGREPGERPRHEPAYSEAG
jgi:hypothetical protein